MQDIEKQFAPYNCLMLFGNEKTPRQRIESKAPTLRLLSTQVGLQKTVEIVANLIKSLNGFLNISRKMNQDQINETAFYVCQQFYFLNISEISNVFSDVKTGKYGICEKSASREACALIRSRKNLLKYVVMTQAFVGRFNNDNFGFRVDANSNNFMVLRDVLQHCAQ